MLNVRIAFYATQSQSYLLEWCPGCQKIARTSWSLSNLMHMHRADSSAVSDTVSKSVHWRLHSASNALSCTQRYCTGNTER